jgi:hypothetical protein
VRVENGEWRVEGSGLIFEGSKLRVESLVLRVCS